MSKVERLNCLQWDSPIGPVLVCAGAAGVCLLQLGGAEPITAAQTERLLGALGRPYQLDTGAHLELLRQVRQAVRAYFDRRIPLPPIPVDIRSGTAFQQRVWQELGRIPFGQTRSYRQVADRIGKPTAARAVGQACGRNPIPIIIPCHRVLAANGKLGGFSGGPQVKEALLALERLPPR